MGKFDKFKGKGKSQKNSLLKINKYESKEAVLDLIAHICTAKDDFEILKYFDGYDNVLMKVGELKEIYSDFNELYDILNNLESELFSYLWDTIELLENNHGKSIIRIAVAGGFSSGKSSLLNFFLGDSNKNLLPTGVEPVSLVITNLTFSKETNNLRIRGKNLKDAYVELDKSVLDSIQHSSKSKVHVASVLKSLYVDVPTPSDEFENISFIDTPGYNNSSAKNDENSKTDRLSAKEAVSLADALIWCVDIESGTISEEDCKMIEEVLNDNDNKDLPWMLILTKRDKKDIDVQKDIFKSVSKLISKRFVDHMPFSIVAFSKNLDTPFLTSKGKAVSDFFKFVWELNGNRNLRQSIVNKYSDIFSNDIENVKNMLYELEENRKKLSKEKKEAAESLHNVKDFNDDMVEEFREFLFEHYENLKNYTYRLSNLLDEGTEGWRDALNREDDWEEKSGMFASTDELIRLRSRAIDRYNKNIKNLNKLSEDFDGWWSEEVREDLFKDLKVTYDAYTKRVSSNLEWTKEEFNTNNQNIKSCKDALNELYNLQKEGINTLVGCFNEFRKAALEYYAVPPKRHEDSGDIFSAISNDNFKRFTSCLSEGVDLSIPNAQGFNVLTYIAQHGNNEMMKYLIDHNADLSLKDDRGLTAFETAVINHYKDICELLRKKDSSVIYTDTPLEELLSKNTFQNWISNLK